MYGAGDDFFLAIMSILRDLPNIGEQRDLVKERKWALNIIKAFRDAGYNIYTSDHDRMLHLRVSNDKRAKWYQWPYEQLEAINDNIDDILYKLEQDWR